MFQYFKVKVNQQKKQKNITVQHDEDQLKLSIT